MSARRITSTYLENLKPGKDNGEVVIDRDTRGHGSLVLRVTDTGKPLYFRYFREGKRRFDLVGYFDPRGAQRWKVRPDDNTDSRNHKGGPLTLAAAREGYRALAVLAKGSRDLKAHFAGEESKRAAVDRKAEDETKVGSFAELLNAYILSLRMENKPSWREADGIFDRHVRKPFKPLLSREANQITAEDVQAILARMIRRGVRRQTNMARSFLHAAFAYAASGQDFDPRRLAREGKAFRLAGNPAGLVPRIAEYDRVLERVLSATELRFYVEKVGEVTNPVVRGFLRLHLYTGAQRVIQLLRAPWTAYDLEDGILTIIDTKGRASAREHLVPLLAEAVQAIETVRPLAGNVTWPFTTSGKAPLRIETVEHAVAEISKALAVDATKRKTTAEPFTLRDVRRTVETALASLAIVKQVRAHLLSHGRGDKISQTYDKWRYLPEKRRALEAWRGYIEAAVADSPNVVPLQRPKRGE